ncbi:glutaredoxin family protein [Caballeronia sp. LZ062]|uniref:glutaredoxin family protein n=1 Tax=unclassified Caballeronia TaxID=2646786 RepID=UPI0028634CFA|nr:MULTISPECIES: glutaredoxin family protein [unclassified Caballeronia]MDR5855005.1 glutaredoxin family protein [Caballeronia sp. LZ050]MDR5870466.1 glutaredoxin family protein [Caballeronia sp. LZ062]
MTRHEGARFVLYGRAWCHLCEDMRAELEPIAQRFNAAIEWIDIDEDPLLEARYNERVPVLMLDGLELCEHRLDAQAVHSALSARRA